VFSFALSVPPQWKTRIYLRMDEEVHHKYEVASTLYKEGRFEEALALFEELSTELPDSKHVIYSRGSCLVSLNRVPEARFFYD
jgi:Flp pilus assembly protein TadD